MQEILSHFEDGVLTLTLNRPSVFNSFNRSMALQLQTELDRCSSDASIRTVVIIGEGKAFCAGQDLAEATDPEGPALQQIVAEHYNPIILKIRALEKPVIAAVNGVAAGAGANIALACDLVVAKESASFIQAFSKIGLIPDAGSSWLLVERLGLPRALALAMTGDKLMAEQAKSWGMIWDVADDPLAAAMGMAEKLATMPTKALVATRKLMAGAHTRSLSEQLDQERDAQSALGKSHDYFEGVKAFLEKRPANFKGE